MKKTMNVMTMIQTIIAEKRAAVTFTSGLHTLPNMLHGNSHNTGAALNPLRVTTAP